MVGYGWPKAENEKSVPKIKKKIKKFGILSIQEIQGAIWEVPEPILELKNVQKRFFSTFSKR